MKWEIIKSLLGWLFRSPSQAVIEQTVASEPLICDDSDDKELNESSGTWRFIKAWSESELESARKKNDASLDAERTASLRGEIRVLKRLANLPDVIKSRDNRLKYSTPPQSAGGDEDDE